ncbi:MAG TPA: ribose-5-phosphate isomerase RpiA [Kofleriaceae bacterium]|nr:ribose-5-phosphate isomerase RpiA [Kofleriaceae bacterium]
MAAGGDDAKHKAALAALAELPAEGVIGIGSGSTARLFIAALGELVARGRRYTCVPTSQASRTQAQELGMPLLSDDGPWDIAVTVDGADEVDDALDLIKGGGGAHTREKIVNFSSRRNVIIVDASKVSRRLGERWPVPVEVLPFAHLATRDHLAGHGKPVLRVVGGAPVRTDSGNLIYDVACGPIGDPPALDRALRAIPGVVETGLFVGRTDVVLIAGESGVERRVRPAPRPA